MHRFLPALLVGLAVVASVAIGAGPTFAATVNTDEVNAIIARLNCPEGAAMPMTYCGSDVRHRFRLIIEQKLAAGESEQQVLNDLTNEFGQDILLVPPTQGPDILIWIVPGIVSLIGVVLAIIAVRAWRRDRRRALRRGEDIALPAVDAAEAERLGRRLEQEMRGWEAP